MSPGVTWACTFEDMSVTHPPPARAAHPARRAPRTAGRPAVPRVRHDIARRTRPRRRRVRVAPRKGNAGYLTGALPSLLREGGQEPARPTRQAGWRGPYYTYRHDRSAGRGTRVPWVNPNSTCIRKPHRRSSRNATRWPSVCAGNCDVLVFLSGAEGCRSRPLRARNRLLEPAFGRASSPHCPQTHAGCSSGNSDLGGIRGRGTGFGIGGAQRRAGSVSSSCPPAGESTAPPGSGTHISNP